MPDECARSNIGFLAFSTLESRTLAAAAAWADLAAMLISPEGGSAEALLKRAKKDMGDGGRDKG